MIQIIDKKECCGCWACYNVCPKQSIKMLEDMEGFRYPSINLDSCINCGLCEKVCPVLHSTDDDLPHKQEGFILQHKDDEIRKQSTSGGAYTAIAKWVLNQGGVVFGAGYLEGTFTVVHQWIEKEEDLFIFRNSKYVQSEMRDCFQQALTFLRAGRWVCFSGTPCQIEGLRYFFRRRNYEKLICVDLVCHGIPSPRILRAFIDNSQHLIGGSFKNILFRDKFYGYHYSSFSIYNEDKKKDYHKGVESNPYLRAFFHNLSDRPSCYFCHFKKRYRFSDFTIWDCFPIEKFSKTMDGNGTTRVLVQSEKGAMILKSIACDVRLEEINPDKLTANVREMFYSVPMNPKRELFYSDLNTMETDAFFAKWFPMTFKVRINSFIRLTVHRLGIYSVVKRIFMLFYTRKDERTR